MNRFRNSINPVVRIENRMFYYSVRNNIIRGNYLDLSSLGFKNIGKYFERQIKETEIDSAYRVKCNYGIYKGFQVRVADYKEKEGEIFVMFDNDSEGEAADIKPRIDYNDKCMRYYEAYVPESEVTDVYEVREAVEGFPFVSPKIVYHKKDGVWLPWHEYGTPLKDGEWI